MVFIVGKYIVRPMVGGWVWESHPIWRPPKKTSSCQLKVDPTEGFLTPLFDAVGDSLMGSAFPGGFPGGNPAVQKGKLYSGFKKETKRVDGMTSRLELVLIRKSSSMNMTL